MPVVKGGVWTNIEDEVLKASVSKYGLNQWARVSSLLARKTPKQCKARWTEWLDPGIRKVEWSKEEDEKLLHLAKLMPTQWRTIAPIVGRTATQCLERYQRLLDEAEQREGDELGLGGPSGGEASAPSADDVRRLRPGETDPDPESKPARPDTIDLDEDEKEMLSEARARLANTQGKKAKRKARERQLEESRRLALLQKRRELKASGINIKVTTKKKGQMDYNADIPFEKGAAPGFYDTREEEDENEREREMFDPRKKQLQNKRKGDNEGEEVQGKRQKKDKDGSASFAAAAKAGQLAKLREQEASSKRRGLNLPAPQVSDAEMEDIVKMGLQGERAHMITDGGESTRGLVGDYSSQVGATPMRTPRAPQEEDRIANEIRNARLRTETQSALLGGDNAELHEGSTTGYQGAAPSKQSLATPNPYKQINGPGATPRGPGATPMRTPRDTFRLNQEDESALVAQTPRDIRLRDLAIRNDLRSKLASLPKPKETDWELELPEEQDETAVAREVTKEDAAIRDERERLRQEAEAKAELRRQSRVVQRGLPRPSVLETQALMKVAKNEEDPIRREIKEGMVALMANDLAKFGGGKVVGKTGTVAEFSEEVVMEARMEVTLELGKTDEKTRLKLVEEFGEEWEKAHGKRILPGLAQYGEDEVDERQLMGEAFDNLQNDLVVSAQKNNDLEKKLLKVHGGYMARAKTLRSKIVEAADFLAKTRIDIDTARAAQASEDAAIRDRLENLRGEVGLVNRLEREAQETYRERRAELEALGR
ncbi:Pre-mRNA-splicing factor cef1 [Sphaceloma murrayae]|uniref:Pre-mRNA-splicing factor cef1 n=1 Tax=Sphaceloma murrayae TaxID=2082308 RepID=A0A2K1QTP8_9PEZI|nr:Pre-mRNA-splicing factor cef1 [Sphaceloma murrayae]